jgi:hypothetical protein
MTHRHGHGHRNRIPHVSRRLLYACTLVLAASGLLWLSVHHWAWPTASRAAMEGLPSPWEPWLMKAHGAAMMLMLFVVGRVSSTHVMRGWRLPPGPHRRLAGGVALLVAMGLLALSGYGLYYLVPDDWRDGLGWVHAGIGGLWVLTLLVHRRLAPAAA